MLFESDRIGSRLLLEEFGLPAEPLTPACPAFDPLHPKDEAMFQAYLEQTHGRNLGQCARSLVNLFISLSGRGKTITK